MILSLLLTLAVFGVVLYIIGQIPMAQPIRNIIYALAMLFLVLWLLRVFGLLPHAWLV